MTVLVKEKTKTNPVELPDGITTPEALITALVMKKRNTAAAVQTALQAYDDGLFVIFINDQEIEPKHPINLQPNDTITIIKLTMLAGSPW